MLKYYASRVRLMEHSAPKNFDDRLGNATEEASVEVLKLIKKLLKKHKHEVICIARSLKPCPYCTQKHFEEYVLIEIINRALARAVRAEEFRRLLGKK